MGLLVEGTKEGVGEKEEEGERRRRKGKRRIYEFGDWDFILQGKRLARKRL